jgi:hypothetical protein
MNTSAMREVLLGRGSDDQLAAIERGLIEREDVALALREAEYDLIDDYVGDRLDAAERAAVELRLLRGAGVGQRLRVARVLRREKEAKDLADLKVAAASAQKRRGAERRHAMAAAQQSAGQSRFPRISPLEIGLALAALVLVLAAVRIFAIAHKTVSTPTPAPRQYAVLSTLVLTRDMVDPQEGIVFQIAPGTTQVVLQLDVGVFRPAARYVAGVARGGREIAVYRGLQAFQIGAFAYVELRVAMQTFASDEPGADARVEVQVANDTDPDDAHTWSIRVEIAQ